MKLHRKDVMRQGSIAQGQGLSYTVGFTPAAQGRREKKIKALLGNRALSKMQAAREALGQHLPVQPFSLSATQPRASAAHKPLI